MDKKNPYLPSIVAKKTIQRRKQNWLLIIVVAWFGMALAAIAWGYLMMTLGLPIGD